MRQHLEHRALVAALSDDALRDASSAAILQRGRTYASSGTVDLMPDEPGVTHSISATVTGTEPYSTEVWIENGEVAGTCDCANAEDGWFCKHQVALALVWRGRLEGVAPVLDEQARKKVQASAKRAQTLKDNHQAMQEFLHSRPAAALADRLLALADRDREIARELQQWRKLSVAPQTAADLKALVTEIMSAGQSFISWRESRAYVHRAEAVVPLLARSRERDAAGAVTLGLHAMRRGWAVLAQADDSNGDIGELIQAVGAEWVQALKQAGPQPAAFGDAYLQVLLDDPFGCFDTAAAEAAIGTVALSRYRKVLAARWREAKDAVLAARVEHAATAARVNDNRKHAFGFERRTERDMRLWTLERLHLGQLEAELDIDGALAAMREDLTEAYRYHQVTSFLERHQRMREAFVNAELGCKAFPDDPRLQEDLLRCYERDGWVEEALALRLRRFDDRPGVERYRDALQAGAAAARDTKALRAELQAKLTLLEEQAMARAASQPASHGHPPGADARQRDVSLRAEVLCSESRWQEALSLVRPPACCRDDVLALLARHLGPEHLAQRIDLLMRVLVSAMRSAKSPYRHELELANEIAELLDATGRASWLQQLRLAYKVKTNFVRGLPVR